MLKTFSMLSKMGAVKAADEERDRGNWSGAAALYSDFLDAVGRNSLTFGYIVQLGNCLKEAQRYDEAMAAYDDALKIRESNSDLHLQRGHLYKMMGNLPAAAWCYQMAYNLDPNNIHAQNEIEVSGARAIAGLPMPAAGQALRTIWFDVTDFIDYAKHNVSLSGIQRVCGNLMLSVERMHLTGYRIVPVLPEYDTGRILAVRYDNFIRLVNLFHQSAVSRSDIFEQLETVTSQRSLVQPSSGDIFMIAGAFWIISNYDKVAEARQRGMKFGLFIHDLIQIRNPDYVMPDAVEKFHIQLSDALDVCDFVLTNSLYVKEDVTKYLRETKGINIPVKDVVLPTELTFSEGGTSTTDFDDPQLKFVLSGEYVLIVSTIEVRKNHKLAVRVWEELRKEFGDNIPHLVFVGKWGWQIDDLRNYINDCGYTGDWLFIFNGISDVMMEMLYKKALFTIYPSFAEGFGLPIGESLAYGTPCIASNTTSMPEVGGEFGRYFDPFDWTTALPVIRQVIVNRADLQQWRDRIADEFHPKRWSNFCEEFYLSAVACAESEPGGGAAALPYAPPRQLITGGDYDILIAGASERPIVTFRAARSSNWHPAEHWGAWSSDRRCEIAFRSNLAEGEPAELFLRLHCAPSSDLNPIVIIDGGENPSHISLTQHPTFYRFTARVRAAGEIRIKLLARGKFAHNDDRQIYIGWSGMAYCRYNNSEELVETIEKLMPSALSL